jgi:hypothetical protein
LLSDPGFLRLALFHELRHNQITLFEPDITKAESLHANLDGFIDPVQESFIGRMSPELIDSIRKVFVPCNPLDPNSTCTQVPTPITDYASPKPPDPATPTPEDIVEPVDEEPTDGVDNPDPSFIQLAPGSIFSLGVESDDLNARLILPSDQSLVRGSVPVFGIASGENFLAYELLYGQGLSPDSWHVVSSSMIDHGAVTIPKDLSGEAGETTLHGNLGNWDVGLREYVYMPDYPPNHPVNLAGVYTLRLVVYGKDGAWIEDRRTVEVGGVVPNAWGARIISDDETAWLDVSAHSIHEPFRLISIRALGEHQFTLPSNSQSVRGPYALREPDERFTNPALLTVSTALNDAPATLGLFQLDSAEESWHLLPTSWQMNGDRLEYVTELAVLPKEGDVVALLSTEEVVSAERREDPEPAATDMAGALVYETFEGNVGNWSNRSGSAGGTVVVDAAPSLDGSHSLRVTSLAGGGNFAVTALSRPFDVRKYPTVSFDYRIAPGVKTDLYAKVSGRWYNVSFTDDEQDFAYKRVNMANIGRIPNVVADNGWHRASFDLARMLATRTGNTLVEELVLADWDVDGYMRLTFGSNRAGATYYIDNFKIARGSVDVVAPPSSARHVVDDFSGALGQNSQGLASEPFTRNGAKSEVRRVTRDDDGALRLSFGGPIGELFTYAGWQTEVGGLDLRGYSNLSLSLRGVEGGELVNVYLDDGTTRAYVDAESAAPLTTTWNTISIPLDRFSNQGVDLSHIETVQLVFEWTPMAGTVEVDDIEFLQSTPAIQE